jgi:hypothetical protein
MPSAPATACLEPGCSGAAVERGRCRRHRRTTSGRGYGTEHERERRAALPGARCERCGCTRNLQRDHRIPVSLGGSQAPANKRWLCRCPEHRCHDLVGLRSDRAPADAIDVAIRMPGIRADARAFEREVVDAVAAALFGPSDGNDETWMRARKAGGVAGDRLRSPS